MLARRCKWRVRVLEVLALPGTPPHRAAALRDACRGAIHDPQLRADAERQKLTPDYVSGEKIAGRIANLIATPADIREIAGKIGE